MDNIQVLVASYVQAYLKNTENVNIRNSATIGTRMPGHNIGENSFTAGINNAAEAPHSMAFGSNNEVDYDANSAVVFGEGNRAYSEYQLVHGKYNDSDSNNRYAHIVGGGEYDAPKNIYTLDWEGKAWFRNGISIGGNSQEDGQDIATKDYLDQNIAIKFFPYYEIDESTVKIYANELDPYTIYKVKMNDRYNRIQFYVKTQFGDIPFLTSDSTMNKYNMFVSEKTEDEMTFIVNSVLYKINLKTGRIEKSIDGSFAGPGIGGEIDIEYARIDDDKVDPNYTWSSQKVSQALEGSFNEARIEDGRLILGRNGVDLESLFLPVSTGSGIPIDEATIIKWNNKMDSPEGTPEANQVLTWSGTENKPVWADPIGGGSGILSTADQVSYVSSDPNIKTVQDALNKLLYSPPSITSFSITDADKRPGTYELGAMIEPPINFSWDHTSSKPIESQTITDIDVILPTAKSASYVKGDITSNKTFTLTISDGTNTDTRDVSYTFGYGIYCGVSVVPDTYDSAFILNLGRKGINSSSNSFKFSVTANSDQYIYFCSPSRFGTPVFNVGGFDGGFELAAEFTFTNSYGRPEYYSVWKSDNKGLGKQTITVK